MKRSLYLMVAVLQILAFGTTQCKIDVEREELCEDDLAMKKLCESSDELLVGEDTSVWLWKSDSYQILKKGIRLVKRAINHYKRGYFRSLSKRTRRSLDESTDIMKNLENWDIETFPTSSMTNVSEKSVKKRETNDETYYLSMLIVVHCQSWECFDNSQDSLYDIIIYQLAFWNAVNRQLRVIKPHVRLRITGFVVANVHQAVPYLIDNYWSWWGFYPEKAFKSMMEHWQKVLKSNDDFSNYAFNTVVTMTNYPSSTKIVASRPECSGPDVTSMAGLLLMDDLSFGSIQFGVQGIAKILGARTLENRFCRPKDNTVMSENPEKISRTWPKCTLSLIDTNLEVRGKCLQGDKDFHRAGKPLETILPGKLIPAIEQCRAKKYKEPVVCEFGEWSTCHHLYCANGYEPTKCHRTHQILDGTTCDKGKVCLNGKCVSETIISS